MGDLEEDHSLVGEGQEEASGRLGRGRGLGGQEEEEEEEEEEEGWVGRKRKRR